MRQVPLFPPEVMGNIPRITLLGAETVQIEQHQGLVTYQNDQMTFRTAQGEVTLTGKELHFLRYTAQQATVGGSIESLRLERRGAGK